MTDAIRIIAAVNAVQFVFLIIQYLAVVGLAWRRLKDGNNGITLAILLNAVGLSMLGMAALFWSVIVSAGIAGEWRLLAGVGIVITLGMTVISNFFLIFSIKVEITRPIRKQLATRSKLFRQLDIE